MVISDSHRFLFVHIPKTAGVSIAAALAPEGNRKHPLCLKKTKHETIEDFVERNGRDVFDHYYSFCVVRHPLDRLISHFCYLRTNLESFPEIASIHSLDQYVESIERGDQSVIRKRERVLPQHCYIKLGAVPVAVREVIRFEDLAKSFSALCERVGLTARQLPTINQSERNNNLEASLHVKQFVERYYETDFQLFGY